MKIKPRGAGKLSRLPAKNSFDLSIHTRVGARYVSFLKQHVRAANQWLPNPLRELSIALVNDAAMSDLHLRFMNIPGPTDVLTFPLDDRSGEVVICLPEARRRAKEHGSAVQNELLLYAIHGMLHLCGLDDRTPTEFDRMHRSEDEILIRLGVGAVFHAPKETVGAGRSLPSRTNSGKVFRSSKQTARADRSLLRRSSSSEVFLAPKQSSRGSLATSPRRGAR